MIQDMTTKDLQQSLVLILDNLGRQKAYAALEIYHEHDQFRQKLGGFFDEGKKNTQNQNDEPEEPDFLQSAIEMEEEKSTMEKTLRQ